jgi:hypothetical protein
MGITPGLPVRDLEGQALGDAAIRRRIELALAALRPVARAAAAQRVVARPTRRSPRG